MATRPTQDPRENSIAHYRRRTRELAECRDGTRDLLVGIVLRGTFGYITMPKREDHPDSPCALAWWPGATATDVEERVTRVVAQALSENSTFEKFEPTARAGAAVVTIQPDDVAKKFDDIGLALSSIQGQRHEQH